jgi:OmpA-OmpF porin, OOP family
MASKKLNFLVGTLSLLTVGVANAQTNVYKGSGYDVLDTALIPGARMDQQRDFLNRNYDYPAKPRSQWELGLSVGPLNVSGDVRSKSFFNRPITGEGLVGSNAWTASLRKAWGYIVSTRLEYTHGNAHGYNWTQSQSHILQNNNPYTAPYGLNAVNIAYKTAVRQLTLDMIASLNNIKFHRARNKMSTYGVFGVGGLLYATKNDLRDASNNVYNFGALNTVTGTGTTPSTWSNSYRDTRKAIENSLTGSAGFDGVFETDAERHNNRLWVGDYTFRPVAAAGAGVQFRLGKRFSLGFEDKVTFTMDDLIDGQRWQEVNKTSSGGLSQSDMTRDFDNINNFKVTLGVNLGGKSVAPLWWLNNELTNPRRLKVGGQVDDCATKDDDNDGVSNCFDKCNDTPLGVAVDTKGCCLDTDADGVCDYKDKQLITPTECQPVDADGIGKCPCNDCGGTKIQPTCGGMYDQNINFGAGSTKLSGAGMSTLNNLAAQMKANPSCNVIIAGNGEGKLEQQRSWMRANSVLNYMNSQGIDRDRFIFQFGQSGPMNSVDLKVAPQGMMGGSIPPPPHPNLK